MTPRQEAEAILRLVNGEMAQALAIVQNQLDVLHSRAQVITSLAGIVVTVTGFSGRIIAATNPTAQFLVIAGLTLVLISAIFVIWRVMRIHWVTADLNNSNLTTIETILIRRNRKTNGVQQGGFLLFSGLVLYFTAFALMLANPSSRGILGGERKLFENAETRLVMLEECEKNLLPRECKFNFQESI